MIRGNFRFRWIWPKEGWVRRTEEIRARSQGRYQAAERLVERAVTSAARKSFRAAVADLVNDTIVPRLSSALDTTLPDDTTERRVIRAMVLRDFCYTWLVSPNWRVLLSYTQLEQSRSWVRRITGGADPLAEPFVDNVCELERAVKVLALEHIEQTFNPLLVENIDILAEELEGSAASAKDREALATYFIFVKLRQVVLEPALEAYDRVVGR